MASGPLTPAQIEISTLFFGLDASHGYLVSGGAGLLASSLIARPTQDLDLFASHPVNSVTAARDALVQAVNGRGGQVQIVRDSATFCRTVVSLGSGEVLVDLAIDSPPNSRPTVTVLGPTLAPEELAVRKILALFGRAEARDFADVYVLVERFDRDDLLRQAGDLDPGFERPVFALMLRTMDRFVDDEIPLPLVTVLHARQYFATWATELDRRSC